MQTQLGSQTFSDAKASVKWMVYGSNQWVSYDDAETLKTKVQYMTSRCLKGFSVWSIDWDTEQFDASAALFGDAAMSRAVIEDTLDDREKSALVADLAAYTGQNCYTTYSCVSSDAGATASGTCQGGYSSVAVAHNPDHIGIMVTGDYGISCEKDSWKHICCPTKQAPQNCDWTPTTALSELFGICTSGCGADQFELTRDSAADFRGDKGCSLLSKRSVSALLSKCYL